VLHGAVIVSKAESSSAASYSSGPDSGTPGNRNFPESGTQKGVRDF